MTDMFARKPGPSPSEFFLPPSSVGWPARWNSSLGTLDTGLLNRSSHGTGIKDSANGVRENMCKPGARDWHRHKVSSR